MLHRYGGLYLDLDMESLKPIDELLAGHSIVLAAIGSDAAHEQSINNCFMASVPGENFWLFYIQAMHARAARGFQKVSSVGLGFRVWIPRSAAVGPDAPSMTQAEAAMQLSLSPSQI